jgi:hypothetical protein
VWWDLKIQPLVTEELIKGNFENDENKRKGITGRPRNILN